MKIRLLFILFSFFVCSASGQLSLIRSCPAGSIGTPPSNFNRIPGGLMYPFIGDAGTNYYTSTNYNGSGETNGAFYWVIFRENNYWKIGFKTSSYPNVTTSIWFKNVLPSNEIDPPCHAFWEFIFNGTPGPTCEYLISGTSCSTVNNLTSVQSGGTTVFGYQLPQYYALDIPNIPNPRGGQMIWDLTNACLKIYNGTSWNCIP